MPCKENFEMIKEKENNMQGTFDQRMEEKVESKREIRSEK